MEGLLLLLFFPMAWPFVAKYIWHKNINATEVTVQIILVVAVTSGVWFIGTTSKMQDVEILNGEITGKNRHHDSYVRSYSCNCREECSGSGNNRSCSTHCDTCYEDHYTVTWKAKTTIGEIIFQHLDSTSRSVYNKPDPTVYTQCTVGEPASLEHVYVNYVRAAPDSLFNTNLENNQFKDAIPGYPRVYNFYRYNRVIKVGKVDVDTTTLNDRLNEALKKLGPKKQVNIQVILTSIKDPSYRHAVENAWIGGKKNDVVVFFGLEGTNIIWTDVMTWALNKGNELLQVKLRDSLRDLHVFDQHNVAETVVNSVQKWYDRPQMREFEYLKESIQPPDGVIILGVIIAIGGSLGLSFFFYRNEMDDVIGEGFAELGRKIKRLFRRK